MYRWRRRREGKLWNLTVVPQLMIQAKCGGSSAMESLVFVCPNTRRQVDTGVTTEITTLLRIRSRTVRARCAACGETHEWPVRDAWLAQAA
jgi:hypothetical protein